MNKIINLSQYSQAERDFFVIPFAEFEAKYPHLISDGYDPNSPGGPSWGNAWYTPDRKLVKEHWDTSG